MAYALPVPATPIGKHSPYFSTPMTSDFTTPPASAGPGPSTRRQRSSGDTDDRSGPVGQTGLAGQRRSRRLEAKAQLRLPPTPESLPRSSTVSREPPVSPLRGKAKSRAKAIVKLKAETPDHAAFDDGPLEPVRKIHLIQETLRYEPWRMLVAVTLLNKTSGRAANPIREEIFARWPSPGELAQASIPDLAEVLYPLGLFNQRANSLIRLSQQYIQLGWPLEPLPLSASAKQPELPDSLDVRVFHGAGIYASDSFRIYSPLFPGRGAPEHEGKWVGKRERARERRSHHNPLEHEGGGVDSGVGDGDLDDWLTDEEEDGGDGEAEEWRHVRPTDKELRRYLIWRWGLEGIQYDIHRGPHIRRPRDKRRLAYLFTREGQESESAL